MADTAPLALYPAAVAPPVATAGNDADTPVFVAPFACTVTAVTYVPSATITGAATNNRTLSLRNKGQAGAGTTVVATLNFANGVNATAFDEKAITLSSTPADLVLAAGDVLALQSLHVGTGITDPGGLVRVSVTRN